jgi:hypothetical protein
MLKLNFNLERQNNKSIINNHINNNNIQKNLFNKDMNFYICSSGGCGSTLLFKYLSQFGNSYHIHDKYPPDKLSYTGSINTDEPVYEEWFNKTEIPLNKVPNYKVIFIYRNPIDIIFSRFATLDGPNIPHMQHIKCNNDGNIHFKDIIRTGRDLYDLELFFDNYTTLKNRNYPIYCIKYEQFFNNISSFNKILNIPDIKTLYPTKYERKKQYTHVKELSIIYCHLINKMMKMRFIEIIPIMVFKEILPDDNETQINDDEII